MGGIEIADFTFSYSGAEPVIKGADWRVPSGSFVVLSGATGSGKSTLLRCLVPALAPNGERRGVCRVEGDAACEAQNVGFVMQDPDNQIVSDTVIHELSFGLENGGMTPDAMRRRVAEIAHFFGMESWVQSDTDSLSGGRKQLLNIASVVVLRPRVLLLDEPTSQLDPIAAHAIANVLARVNRELGITVVVATHEPKIFTEYTTSAVRLTEGRIEPCELPESYERFEVSPGIERSDDAEPMLCMRDAYFTYERGLPWVVRGMDLDLHAGRVHALVGGNSCGKSTVLSLLAGARRPLRGKVGSRGKPRRVLLPQNPLALFVCDTVYEELCEWKNLCGYSEADVERVACECEVEALFDAHPYDVSGGQRQLIALAKLLLTEPDIMLLDEPTKGLDAASKCAVARLLRRERDRGAAIAVASHDLAFCACIADEVSLLFDGQTACTEDVETFFSTNLFYVAFEDGFTRTWREWEESCV